VQAFDPAQPATLQALRDRADRLARLLPYGLLRPMVSTSTDFSAVVYNELLGEFSASRQKVATATGVDVAIFHVANLMRHVSADPDEDPTVKQTLLTSWFAIIRALMPALDATLTPQTFLQGRQQYRDDRLQLIQDLMAQFCYTAAQIPNVPQLTLRLQQLTPARTRFAIWDGDVAHCLEGGTTHQQSFVRLLRIFVIPALVTYLTGMKTVLRSGTPAYSLNPATNVVQKLQLLRAVHADVFADVPALMAVVDQPSLDGYLDSIH
jgi:hypothetical protein